MKILLVEDDERIAFPLAEALGDQNYAVDVAEDGELGWDYLDTYTYSLVLLDVMLPRLSGIQLCQRMRQRGLQTPVLMLTARDTSTDKVLGLDAGADDYVVKPFDLQELLARIRALLRRGTVALTPVLVWSALELDPNTCQVTCEGQDPAPGGDRLPLPLTPKEYQILELLMRNPQRTFSRDDILNHLWATEETPGADTVKVHIRGLRQKLTAAGLAPDAVETVYGLGYRLKQG
ncbi:response regulator transcription factor [Nodosilinea nodulosa]|uniref:response regulator transcription factor n=1 Tax=Nodosilinea nodulosa TaxID=416001 RepID=UPI0002F1595E|nr:response regulator transcription factor [Nodosilinea nodulosa]